MKKFFRSKKFVGFSSLVLATSLVVGTLAIRRSKDGNGLKIGSSTVYADENLLDYDSASLINYSTILGRAIDYGILSDTVDQKGHMETTYATNKFINPQAANNCDVDLAGSKPAQFIIASVENGSKARFGQTYAMREMDFVIDTTYDMSAHEDDYFVYDDTCKANVLYRTYDYSVLKQNVDSMIGKIVKQSDILAAKSAFDGDSIATKRGDSGATIDLSDPQYKDATIYINVEGGSNLEKAIQKSDGLLIIKDPSTNVVFNMLGNGPLELCQYRVEIIDDSFTMDEANGKEKKVEGKESNYSFDSTTTCSGEDSLHNAHVEKYMTKSIIWNIRNASSVKYNTTAGLFLVPTNITGDVTGSSAGWIASAGRTIVSSGEFHYIHHDRSDLGNTTDTSVLHFAARKGFVSSYARNAQGKIEELTNVKLSEGEYTFSFTETESDYSTPKQDGVSSPSISVDAFSKITFPDITVDVKTIDPNIPQKRYFVVKENPTTPSDPNIELSKGEIDIELSIENIDGIIHYTVNTKKYFTEKTSPTQPEDDGDTNIQASGAEFSLGAFLNKYNKKEAELTLKKEISGDAPDASKTYRIAVKKGSQFVQNDGSLGGAEHYFQVPADGTGIKIKGLVPGEYTIVEDEGNIQGFNLTGTTMSAKVTTGETTTGPSDITSDGKITLSADSKGEVTVTNTYEQVNVTGKASITLEKQIELDGKPCAVSDLPEELASKEFEFVVFVQSTNQYVTDSFGALGSDGQKKIFKVKPGETVTIYGLDPNQEYQVKELMDYNKFIVLNGYTLSGISINGADQSNFYDAIATVTTGAADSDTKAETVNSYNSIKKNLSVTKRFVLKNNSSQSVLNDLEEARLDAIKLIVSGSNGYTHEITGEELRNNGWTVVIPNVPAGPCTITEINGNGTSTNALTFSDYEVTGSSPTKDNDGQLTVTNNYREIHTGQLQLQKIVQSNGVATPSNYEVYIQNSEGKYYNPTTGAFVPSAPDGNNPTVTVPANGSNSIVLPEGEYTITEKEESAAVPGSSHVVSYKAGNKEGSNVVDLKQHGGQITITNTYTKYSIKVTKQEAGDHMYNNWTYEFWIKDTSRTDGTYYIAKDGSSVRLEDGKEPYYFSIKAGDANSVDIPVMNAGNYQVIEKDENVAANNAFALVTTYSPAGGNVALNDQNTSANVTITNTYEYINHGSLKITKNLSGAGADPDKVFDIEVAFSMPVKYSVDGASPIATASDTYTAHLKAGESVVLSKIPAGVTYTVTETIDAADAAAGYSLDDIDGDTNKAIVKGEQNEVSVNNAYASAETIDLTVKKVWDDSNNQDGKRPASVTVHLQQNGANFGEAVTLNEANNWTATKDNLPKYDASNSAYTYTWVEDAVTDYTATSSVSGNVTTITNKYEAEKTTLTVKKVWEHKTNAAANYPASVTVELYANNAKIDTVTLNAANSWTQDVSNLPVYDNGQKITYEWKETAVANYNATYAENAGTTTITNTFDISTERTEATVKKVWDDSNNQDGKRPASVTVHLQQNGVNFGEAVTLNEANNWTATKDDLPKYDASANEYAYTWVEDAVTDYTATSSVSGNVTTITNKHEAEKTTLTVKKVWEHKTNAAANYPASVTVELYANNAKIDTVTLNAANSWTQDVSNLPVYDNGQKITYEWKETAVANYTTTYSENAGTTTITNTFDISTERTEATVKKVWDDSNNQDGIRPTSVTVHLKQNGANFGEAVTLSEANNWTATKDNLPKYDASANEYAYTWEEDAVTDYTATSSVSGNVTTITNKHEAEKTTLTVKKVWEHKTNAAANYPTSVKVDFLVNGTAVKTVELNESNNWTETLRDLAVYSGGQKITYEWKETAVANYNTTYAENAGTTTITNTFDISTERTEATVKKVWDDSNNQDGKRPASVTVHLQQNGANFGEAVTLNEANNWTATKDDLPKYDASANEYAYTWAEDAVTDYTATSSVSGNVTTITNKHEAEKTTLTVKKVWEHKTNAAANYPASVTVELYANNAKIDTVTLNAANSWTQDVSNLPVYDNGQKITYEWKETAVANYTTTYSENAGTTTITNTFDISTERTEATVKKVWDDSNNQDGIRPTSVTVHLKQNGANFGEAVTLSEANNWTATKDDLPKYDASANEYAYTWEEDAVTDYTATSSVSGNVTTITNKHEAEKTTLTVKKVWEHKTNAAANYPTSVKVDFLVNGTAVKTVELNESNNWTETLRDLAVYSGGQKITYEWKETAVANYNTTYAENAGTTTITNTYDLSTEKVSATVKKVWDDSNNQDGIRPTSVTVHLQQNGVNFGEAVTLSEANNWTATKDNLPKYDASNSAYTYTWVEDAVTDYTATSSVSGNVTTITNKHEAEKTTLTVKKVWEHKTNAAANYPASVTVELYANNAKIDTVTLNAANRWTQDVSNLPVYDNGQKITYEWKETAVANYNTTYAENAGTTTITNTFDTSTERTEATVKKVWDDSNNQDGIRPTSVTVHLQQNGVNFGEAVTLNEANNWTATKDNLPKYDASNSAYTYTWVEDAVTDYAATSSVSGNVTTITNKHTAEVVSVSVEKIWDDSNNQDGIRPASLDVTLQKNGADLKTVTLNEANGWSYTEANLPKNENGTAITYTWSEPSVTGYTSTTTVSGNKTTLTNKHTAEVVSVTVEKVWDDSNDQDGLRPASLDVKLQKNGADLKTVTLNEANGWSYTETNLPKNENGTAITYTWSEPSVTGYTSGKTESGNKTTFTNSHTAAVISLTVEKAWDDNNNQDGIRPSELKVTLLKNDVDYAEVTLNDANNWTATVDNLPAKSGAQENVYKWEEKTVPTGYTFKGASKSGSVTTLINEHAAEEITLTVEKVWDDNGNVAGQRPASLKVTLKADGAYYADVTLDKTNNWTATKTVPKYNNGTEVSYSWEEDVLPQGYTKTSTVNGNTTTLINTYDLSREKTSVTVKKVWDDNNNADGKRPASLEMTLSNGTVVTLSEANGWSATVDDLAKYDSNGTEITYTWTEGAMPQEYSKTGEETVGNTTTFTNTYTAPAPVLGSLKIEKILGADAPASAASKTYHFTVTGPNGYKKDVEIQGAGTVELTDLELGIYTITENEEDAKIDGYTLSVSNNGVSVELKDATQKTEQITNNYTKNTEPTQTQPTDTQPTDTQPTDTNPTGTAPTATESSESKESSTETAPSDGPSEESPTPTPDKTIVDVTIDDNPVSPENYKKKPDGTVEFTPETIEGLTLGAHRAVIKYSDGSTKTIEFEVITSSRGNKIVKTGDVGGVDIVPVVSLFTIAAASLAIMLIRKRRSQHDEQ